MFASDSYLHFILDNENDLHYTDSRVPLGPKAYIWYWLRRRGIARNVLLVDVQDDGQLSVEVFDSGSARLFDTPKKSVLPFGKKEAPVQSIAYRIYSLADTVLTEETLLSRLLSAAGACDDPTALVFSQEAFVRACGQADGKGEKLLRTRLDHPVKQDRLFIRLPRRTDALLQLVCSDCADGSVADCFLAPLRGAATYGKMPLLEALSKQLGSQLLRFDRDADEMLNLLLMQAAANPDAVDTWEQLNDQAEYLALCRCCRAGILAPSEKNDLSRPELDKLIRDPEFCRKLRRNASALRTQYPNRSMEEAMRQQNLLPYQSAHPIYHDDLTRKVLSLRLPEEYLRQNHSQQIQWPAVLAQIRQDLTILWNRPRNDAAVRAAEALCGSAHSAIISKNWDSLDILLLLLQFFSRQVCASREQTDALEEIHRYSREIVQICDYVYGERSFGLPSDFNQFIDASILAGDKAHLESLKAHVHNTIQRFEHPGVTFTNISEELEEDRSRLLQDLMHANQYRQEQQALEQSQREAAERQRREQELASRYNADSCPELEPEDFPSSEKLPNSNDLLFE